MSNVTETDAAVRGVFGRTVIVAGATGEAGHAVCAALADAGANVVAVGSKMDRLAGVRAEHRYVCDLADEGAVEELVRAVHHEVGSVDGLIHLVGGWRSGHADRDWVWLEERIMTTLRHTSAALRNDLGASEAGRLAIVSSTAVDKPTWGNANYATLKCAAETWVASIASAWAKLGNSAAVSFVVKALGDEEGFTPVEVLAERVVSLWDAPAFVLNGQRIRL